METVIMVFMAFVCLITLLIVLVVMKDMFTNSRNKKEATVTKETENVEKVEPQESEVILPVVEASETDEGAITFAKSVSETHQEKYTKLSKKEKGYYDEIAKYASGVEGVKVVENDRYVDYKVGQARVVRLSIKRGVIISQLMLPNSDFKNYVSDNKIAVKIAPAVIRVTEAGTVGVVKDSIDIVVKEISAEKERKREIALAKRRERRAQKQL